MAITERTRKLLWGPSGNKCAYCRRTLSIDATAESDESVVGDECHIVSRKGEGPRYDPTYPPNRIDDVDNLLLLCRVDHKRVDDQSETYTPDVLRKLKADHEDWVAAAMASALERSLDPRTRGEAAYQRTFVSSTTFFAAKAPRVPNPILDFSRTLYGRSDQLQSMVDFLESGTESICLFSGRGGIGKSKLLHDWSVGREGWSVVFLKDAPLWHPDSVKEIPAGKVVIVVDDAHRSGTLPEVLQLFGELRSLQPLKLVLSTRPGGVLELERLLYRSLGASEVLRLPDLEELTPEQAEALAEEVLGADFNGYARDLASVSDNSPLVVVAGGNLIVSRHILPAEMSGLEDFRRTVFSRFYDELKLSGPDFAINPPRQLLQVVAALGPINATTDHFISRVAAFLDCSSNDVLSTLDALATYGVITPRNEPERIVPDVLSDYVLETACVGSGLSTGYADRVFDAFGDEFFERLMQNLSELDWRLGRVGRGLDLLGSVWNQIFTMFREADFHRRRKLLEELRPAAVYQPNQILELVRLARTEPLIAGDIPRRYHVGRKYLVEILPSLLEATCYHFDYISRSVDVLWELALEEDEAKSSDSSAKGTLERLASYQRYKWPAFNFAMLLQAIRLARRSDAFEQTFTPLELVDKILEREGEFSEYSGHTISYGGFGLNHAAVASVRQNALEYLDSLLYSDNQVMAIRSVASVGDLLSNVMNRVGRESQPDEIAWQQAERLQAVDVLTRRLEVQPLALPVRRGVIDALRSGTGLKCSSEVRARVEPEIEKVVWDVDLLLLDAICCRSGDFPVTSEADPIGSWDVQSNAQLSQLDQALREEYETLPQRAQAIVGKVKLAYACRMWPNGFDRVVGLYSRDGALLSALVDCISTDVDSQMLTQELGTVLSALHVCRPEEFRARTWTILSGGVEHQVIAAGSALRVHADEVTADDISLIELYLAFPDSRVKRHCLHAIAYMGKKPEVQPALLRGVLGVNVAGDSQVAAALVDVFGPYGVWLTGLSDDDVRRLLTQLASVEDFSVNQGRIPSFLSRLTGRFPDAVLVFLLNRVATEEERRSNGDWSYRAIDSAYSYVSFGTVQSEDKVRLVRTCLNRYLEATPPASTYRKLFWNVMGALDDAGLSVLSEAVIGADDERISRVITLIQTSPGRLVLGNPGFVKAFLRNLSGAKKAEAVVAFVENAYSLGSAGFAAGPNQIMEQNRDPIASVLNQFQDDEDSRILYEALSSTEPPKYTFGSPFGLQGGE
jgi:hypothetical protein